jgi:hypothetical protein
MNDLQTPKVSPNEDITKTSILGLSKGFFCFFKKGQSNMLITKLKNVWFLFPIYFIVGKWQSFVETTYFTPWFYLIFNLSKFDFQFCDVIQLVIIHTRICSQIFNHV